MTAATRPMTLARLNRTFYGIETTNNRQKRKHREVLIVPFMELKHNDGDYSEQYLLS